MDKNTNDNSLKKQIRERMLLKETEELLEIWNKDDHGEWSEEAFQVVNEILRERLGRAPARKKQTDEVIPIQSAVLSYQSKLATYLSWAKAASWVALGLYILIFVSRLVWDIQNSSYNFAFNTSQLLALRGTLSTLLTGVVFFLLLQVAAACGQILIEMKSEK